MSPEELSDRMVAAIEDLKGEQILTLKVSHLTPMADYMILVSGTSNRHVKAIVDNVSETAKALGHQPAGIEGRESYDWVLVDLGDIVVHAMSREAREFYELERLWSGPMVRAESELGKQTVD